MQQKPPATLAMIILSILVYLGMILFNQEAIMRLLLISEYLSPSLPEIQDGQYWRLVTPIFLHFDIFHIVFNMLWIWEFGRLVEARQGSLMVLLATAVIGIASNLGQYYVSGPVFGGMSGVVYGFFGYVWIQGLINPSFGVRINRSVVYLLLGWFLLCWSTLLEKLFDVHVANVAHTAGLLSGILLALLFGGAARLTGRRLQALKRG